jgi:hypothetical protein
MILRSDLSAGQIERLVLAYDHESLSTSLLDQIAFIRSRTAICYYGNENGFQFAYRSLRWSGNMYPVTRLTVVKDKEHSYVKMEFQVNALGKLITALVFIAAAVLVLSQTGPYLFAAKSPIILLLFSLLVPLVFTAPFLLIARQARKETYWFMQDLLSGSDTEEKKLYQTKDGILWTGELNDSCTARWNGLILHAHSVDISLWRWTVSKENGGDAIDSSDKYVKPVLSGNEARKLAEECARNYSRKKSVGNVM